jgi:hypothetical protein
MEGYASLTAFPPTSKAILRRLYEFQGREEYKKLLEETPLTETPLDTAWTKTQCHDLFAFTRMHKYVLGIDDEDLSIGLSIGHEGAIPDILGWTPLHYASSQECYAEMVEYVFL